MVLYLKETPQLVAHNAPFDMGVLKKRLYSYGIQWMERATYLCTVQIGRSALPGMRPGLGDMCDYYGIELDHHKADSDSHAAGEILLRYMGEDTPANITARMLACGMHASVSVSRN